MNAQPRKTESKLPESSGIDTWSDAEILGTFVAGQEQAIAAVKAAIPQISKAQRHCRLSGWGGRLFYAGAGTSIRIGVQDGSELPATFGMAEDRIVYHCRRSRGHVRNAGRCGG
jgi:N-acetylmuramic acid 6-phosphate etherase